MTTDRYKKKGVNQAVVEAGLRPRPQMQQIINYLEFGQERVRFPDREAKFIRNHPYMTQFDMFELVASQEKEWEEANRKQRIRDIARDEQMSEAQVEALLRRRTPTEITSTAPSNDTPYDGPGDVYAEETATMLQNWFGRAVGLAQRNYENLTRRSSMPSYEPPREQSNEEDEFVEVGPSGSRSIPTRIRIKRDKVMKPKIVTHDDTTPDGTFVRRPWWTSIPSIPRSLSPSTDTKIDIAATAAGAAFGIAALGSSTPVMLPAAVFGLSSFTSRKLSEAIDREIERRRAIAFLNEQAQRTPIPYDYDLEPTMSMRAMRRMDDNMNIVREVGSVAGTVAKKLAGGVASVAVDTAKGTANRARSFAVSAGRGTVAGVRSFSSSSLNAGARLLANLQRSQAVGDIAQRQRARRRVDSVERRRRPFQPREVVV
jgi:hypothetical protein